MHLTESLTLADTSTASDDESDAGTEDVGQAFQPDTGGSAGSDVEKDTFKDARNVTDNLTLAVNLHSTEKVTAADGTVTETDVDLGDQDNVQDKEKDTVADKHTNNASPPSQGGANNGSPPSQGGAGGVAREDCSATT